MSIKLFSGFHSISNLCGSVKALARNAQKTKIPPKLQARMVYLHANRPAAGQNWQTKTVYMSFYCSNTPPCPFMPTSSNFYQLITILHRGDNPKGAITRSIYLFWVKPQSEILHNVWSKGVIFHFIFLSNGNLNITKKQKTKQRKSANQAKIQ